jgi:microcystin degradation protein MlrC
MFENIIKQLLQGEFICEISDESAFQFLQDAGQANTVDEFLSRLGYRLAKTQNELAFYAAYQHIDHSARTDIRKTFQQFRIELYPVVEWLDMMMACLNQDNSLSPGDTLSFSSLMQAIEQNQALADRLLSFAKFKDFASSDDSIKARLEKLLSMLNKWGYLKLANRDMLIYQVTGKLDYFYHALQFIQEHEQISIEQAEDDVIQESLL